jgi:cell division protein FtsL
MQQRSSSNNPNFRRNAMNSSTENKVFYYTLAAIVAISALIAQAGVLITGVAV